MKKTGSISSEVHTHKLDSRFDRLSVRRPTVDLHDTMEIPDTSLIQSTSNPFIRAITFLSKKRASKSGKKWNGDNFPVWAHEFPKRDRKQFNSKENNGHKSKKVEKALIADSSEDVQLLIDVRARRPSNQSVPRSHGMRRDSLVTKITGTRRMSSQSAELNRPERPPPPKFRTVAPEWKQNPTDAAEVDTLPKNTPINTDLNLRDTKADIDKTKSIELKHALTPSDYTPLPFIELVCRKHSTSLRPPIQITPPSLSPSSSTAATPPSLPSSISTTPRSVASVSFSENSGISTTDLSMSPTLGRSGSSSSSSIQSGSEYQTSSKNDLTSPVDDVSESSSSVYNSIYSPTYCKRISRSCPDILLNRKTDSEYDKSLGVVQNCKFMDDSLGDSDSYFNSPRTSNYQTPSSTSISSSSWTISESESSVQESDGNDDLESCGDSECHIRFRTQMGKQRNIIRQNNLKFRRRSNAQRIAM
eukprot:68053_1